MQNHGNDLAAAYAGLLNELNRSGDKPDRLANLHGSIDEDATIYGELIADLSRKDLMAALCLSNSLVSEILRQNRERLV